MCPGACAPSHGTRARHCPVTRGRPIVLDQQVLRSRTVAKVLPSNRDNSDPNWCLELWFTRQDASVHACISTRLGKRVNLPSWRFNICKTVLFFDASEIVVELSCTVSGMEKLLGGRVSRINGDFSFEYSSTIVRRKPISLCPDSYCIYLEKRYSFYLTTIFHHVPFYYFIYSGKTTTFRRRRSIFFRKTLEF